MEGVVLVERHHVEVLLDEANRHEVARHVEVHAAVAKAGDILNIGAGDAGHVGLQLLQL